MKTIGMVTIGQSPRLDWGADLTAVLPSSTSLVQAGALDGMTYQEVNALDFMVKPVNYFSMEQQFIKAENILTKKKRRYVTIPTGKGLSRLDASVITYIESYSHKLIIHSEKGEFPLNETMRNMELLFADYGFYRCNNSYLVNLNFTERVENNIVFVAGNKLIISRPKRKAFMEALVKYIGEVKG